MFDIIIERFQIKHSYSYALIMFISLWILKSEFEMNLFLCYMAWHFCVNFPWLNESQNFGSLPPAAVAV